MKDTDKALVRTVEILDRAQAGEMNATEVALGLDALATEYDVHKAQLVTQAQKVIEGRAKKDIKVNLERCTPGSFGCVLDKAPPKAKAVEQVANVPFVGHTLHVAPPNGKLTLDLTAGQSYIVLPCPEDVQVNVQPPAMVAGGALRCVCSLTAPQFVVVPLEEVPDKDEDKASTSAPARPRKRKPVKKK